MRILAIYSGDYGLRHIDNVRRRAPAPWRLETWRAPATFPLMIDYPEDFIPDELPAADLLISFGEHRGVAELLPEIAQMIGVKGVIAGVDSEAWLPRGLARQLRGWLERIGVDCVTPKPLCSLTEKDYLVTRREKIAYDNEVIAEFARHFGAPAFRIQVDESSGKISQVETLRDAVCGCASFVAEKLVGTHVDEAAEQAGLHHHHYPCLASMGIDADFNDTLMHVSGNILKDAVAKQVRPYRDIKYLRPGQHKPPETGDAG